MNKAVKAQLAILCGVFGFFAGGLINSGKEIVDVMLGAVLGWGLVFFAVFFILEARYKDAGEINDSESKAAVRAAGIKAEKNKGKRIDITEKSEDSFEDIYKMK
jgi:hypothetical protein